MVRRFSEEAENGDAKAKFIIGGCYYTGSRLAKDFAEAVKWWRKAAEQGNANAQFNLGICYAKGQGVTQNFAEASKWYFQAAGQGKTMTAHPPQVRWLWNPFPAHLERVADPAAGRRLPSHA